MLWDDEDFDIPTKTVAAPVALWEDEEDDEPLLEELWDVDEEEVKAKKAAEAAAKEAERLRLKAKHDATVAARKSKKNGEQKMLDIDLVDEATRKEMLKAAELNADLNNAADLFGGLGVAEEHPRERAERLKQQAQTAKPVLALTADTPLDVHPLFKPKTKPEFEKLRKTLAPALTGLAEELQLNYTSALAVDLIRDLAKPLAGDQLRKVISTLEVMLKEKARADRQARLAKAGGTATGGAGKKKAKPKLQSGMSLKKDDDLETTNYDDFGDDDFM